MIQQLFWAAELIGVVLLIRIIDNIPSTLTSWVLSAPQSTTPKLTNEEYEQLARDITKQLMSEADQE